MVGRFRAQALCANEKWLRQIRTWYQGRLLDVFNVAASVNWGSSCWRPCNRALLLGLGSLILGNSHVCLYFQLAKASFLVGSLHFPYRAS